MTPYWTGSTPKRRSAPVSEGPSGAPVVPAVRPHRCGGCDARWSGAGVCHCSGCHRTFTGLASFDYHRAGGECRDPKTVKKPMSVDGYGRWGWPETEGAIRRVPRPARSAEADLAPAPVRDAEGPQNAVQGVGCPCGRTDEHGPHDD